MSDKRPHNCYRSQGGSFAENRCTIPTLYINREFAKDRRASIEVELQQAGIVGERVCAVEGTAVLPGFAEYFFEDDRLHSGLKPGEVGAYASHLKALSVVVERGLAYALILEDDAQLPRDLTQTIESILAKLPKDWDIVRLCRDSEHAVKPVGRLGQSRMLVRYSRVPSGAVAYLISQAGAKKFLVPTKRYWPVDTDIRQPWRFGLSIYGANPSVVAHYDKFASSIGLLGGRSRLRRGLPIPSPHCWTGNPLHTPQGFYFNLKTLGLLCWARCFLQNTHRRTARILGLQNLV